MATATTKYCGMCDKVGYTNEDECPECGSELERVTPHHRRMTRQERLEWLADRGVDTWEDYRGER